MNYQKINYTIFFGVAAVACQAQLRVATWNVTNYSSGRDQAFKTAIYGSYQGRSMSPDVILGQEFTGASSITNFVNMLNSAGGPTDWRAAPYLNHGDTSQAFFYRSSKINFLGQSTVLGDPRNVGRYDIQFKGYTDSSASPTLALYSTHMKAGSTSADQARRLVEANNIRANANALPSNYDFILGGDFNIQTSTQAAYQAMVGAGSNTRGQFKDPINSPGSWNNSNAYRFLHTQDPSGSGGMDDRFDQLLMSNSLGDGKGFDYIGNSSLAYSNSTWDDPNHSYRVWGNDGTSFNGQLRTTGNSMVGSDIANALIQSTGNTNPNAVGGHLPVFMDLRMRGEIGTSVREIDFGDVMLGAQASFDLLIGNIVDEEIWSIDGIQALRYSLAASSGFLAPNGTFMDAAGGGWNSHLIGVDTSQLGLLTGTLTITDISGISSSVFLRANVTAVPEPASMAMLGLGVLAMIRKKRAKKS